MSLVLNFTNFKVTPSYNVIGQTINIDWTVEYFTPASSILTVNIRFGSRPDETVYTGPATVGILTTQSGTVSYNMDAVDMVTPEVTIDGSSSIISESFTATTTTNRTTINTSPAFCVAETTRVHTDKGLVQIKDLRSGKGIKILNLNNEWIDVKFNMKMAPPKEYINISKNALGKNKPSNDLLIRKGHPILIDGKEVFPETLINKTTISIVNNIEGTPTYSLCTQNRTFVWMDNILVCTWEEDELNKSVEKFGKKFFYEKI